MRKSSLCFAAIACLAALLAACAGRDRVQILSDDQITVEERGLVQQLEPMSSSDSDQLPEYVQFLIDCKNGVSAWAIGIWGTEAAPQWEIHYASSGRILPLAGGDPEITQDGDVLYVGEDRCLHRLQLNGADLVLGPLVGSSLVLDSTERYIAYLQFREGDCEDARWDVAVFDLESGRDRKLLEPGPELNVSIWGWFRDKVILWTSNKYGPHSGELRLQLLSLDGTLSDWGEMAALPSLDLYTRRSFDGRFIAYQAMTEPTSVVVIDLETLNVQTIADCSEPEWAEVGLTVMADGRRQAVQVRDR